MPIDTPAAVTTKHATFVVERTMKAPVALVYNAFADKEAKSKWFVSPPDWDSQGSEFDFREGGRESDIGGEKGGPVHAMYLVYFDIVPSERIVYSYEMQVDGKRISVSLSTIEFAATGDGTHLKLTEQGAYFDGSDDGSIREEGTAWLIDNLKSYVEAAAAGA